MTGELVNIFNNNGCTTTPCRAAHAFVTGDAEAGHATLERTEYQLVTLYQVEAYPEELHGVVNGGGDVGHHAYLVGFTFNQTLHLVEK